MTTFKLFHEKELLKLLGSGSGVFLRCRFRKTQGEMPLQSPDGETIGRVRVTYAGSLFLDVVTEEDAREAGFSSKEELALSLHNCGPLRRGLKLFLYRVEVVSWSKMPRS